MLYSVRWILVLCPNNNFLKRILLYSFHSNTWTLTAQNKRTTIVLTLSRELGTPIPERQPPTSEGNTSILSGLLRGPQVVGEVIFMWEPPN